MIGVLVKLPGTVPNSGLGRSSGRQVQATRSWSTFSDVTVSAGDDLVLAWSPPTYGHSTMVALPGWRCPAGTAVDSPARYRWTSATSSSLMSVRENAIIWSPPSRTTPSSSR